MATQYKYHVDGFQPQFKGGCGTKKQEGWTPEALAQFKRFLSDYAEKGWKLHSWQMQSFSMQMGCGMGHGQMAVCVFEAELDG